MTYNTQIVMALAAGLFYVMAPCGIALADNSKNLTITVQPSTTNSATCDAGPNASATPAQATEAGFTRCALNADFTQVGGYFSKVATFVDGCGGQGANLFQAYYSYTGTQVPCDKLKIEQDNGVQVLHLQQLPGDGVGKGGSGVEVLELAYPTLKHGGGVQSGWPQPVGQGAGNGFPQEMYAEIVFRSTVPTLTQNGANLIPVAWWQMPALGQPSNRPEQDYIEINTPGNSAGTNPNGTSGIEWGCSTGFPHCAVDELPMVYSGDWTQYHKYAELVTSDGQSNVVKCRYVDDVKVGCQAITPFNQTNVFPDRTSSYNYLVAWLGSRVHDINTPADMYIKSMSVWECGTYQTTNCHGTYKYGANQLGDTWTLDRASTAAGTAPDGSAAIVLTENTTSNWHAMEQPIPPPPPSGLAFNKFSVNVAQGASKDRNVSLVVTNDTDSAGVVVDLSSGQPVEAWGPGAIVKPLASGGYNITMWAGGNITRALVNLVNGSSGANPYQGNGSSSIIVWGAQFLPGSL